MSRAERLARLNALLAGPNCRSRQSLEEELQVSRAQLTRDIGYLRDRLNHPITYDRALGGYRLDAAAAHAGQQYELPGLWLSAEEIHALLTINHLLANLDAGGLLAPHISPLIDRLTSMLADGTGSAQDLARRIVVQTVGARRLHLPDFQRIGTALLRRKRLLIVYHARGRDEESEREISPQRLIHYRDNWYLDAWCHLRTELRSFSVDVIRHVSEVERSAIEVPQEELDAKLGSGYGIFAGSSVQWAELRFTPHAARWVAAETWHRQQEGRFDAEGHYWLRLPYADPTELVMDILRHLPEVEVRGPEALQRAVLERVEAGLRHLHGGNAKT
ncbi:MAG TPA: transcriptional regulator [Gammaproteobacteria bacterium]|nr:transcriptional regulator [Gammaproteobacteria bacterium]